MRGNPCYNQGLGWVWVAYPGSVSAGVCRESWDERKKDRGMKGGGGGGEKKKKRASFPPTPSSIFFFLLSFQFSRNSELK